MNRWGYLSKERETIKGKCLTLTHIQYLKWKIHWLGLTANGHYRKKRSVNLKIYRYGNYSNWEQREKIGKKKVQVFIIYGIIQIGSKKHTSWSPSNRRDRVNRKKKRKKYCLKFFQIWLKTNKQIVTNSKSRKQSKPQAC